MADANSRPVPRSAGQRGPGFLTALSSGVGAGAKALATFTPRKPSIRVCVCWMVPVSLTWTEVTISPAFFLFKGTHWQEADRQERHLRLQSKWALTG